MTDEHLAVEFFQIYSGRKPKWRTVPARWISMAQRARFLLSQPAAPVNSVAMRLADLEGHSRRHDHIFAGIYSALTMGSK